ncbi:hypothetical protein ACN469_23745 [Corallococcus terminator]
MNHPTFITEGGFNGSSRGLHYTLSDNERAQLLSRQWPDEPWKFLARVVELAKAGDFSEVGSLSRFFEVSKEVNIAPVALLLTGGMGSRAELMRLTQVMHDGPDGLRVYACQAARNAGSIWLVPHMLEAWNRCSGVDAHQSIGLAIADLLDPIAALDDLGPIGAKAGIFDFTTEPSLTDDRLAALALKLRDRNASTDFNRLVIKKHEEVLALCESEDDAIWAGERAGATELSRHFLRMLLSPAFDVTQAPLTVVLREKFEATTGLDCSAFFRAGGFVRHEAVDLLERFLASPTASDFTPGARYFFAHPIT